MRESHRLETDYVSLEHYRHERSGHLAHCVTVGAGGVRGTVGCFRWKPVASWYTRATASALASSNSPARKVSDTGVPSSRKPFGIITAGCPVRLVATSCDRLTALVGVTITSTVRIRSSHFLMA